MKAIFKKELKSYFLSPIGYIVMGIFLLCFSTFFVLSVIDTASIDLGSLYYYTALYGFLIIIPILTMRMFSEERKNGTEQLLLTSPVGMFGVVMGKLLAALVVMLVPLVLSLGYFVILMFLGSPSIMPTLAAIFGFVLISIAALSLGMFISSLTENQIISAVATLALLLLPLFLGGTDSIITKFILMEYFTKFAQGVISIENVISYLLYSAVFISFTVIVMQRRKLVK